MGNREEIPLPPPPRHSGAKWVFLGCGTAILFVLFAIGAFVALFVYGWHSYISTEPVVTAFLNAVDRGDYNEAYGMLSPQLQASHPKQAIVDKLRHAHDKLGVVKEKYIVNWHYSTTPAGTTANVEYHVTFTKGSAELRLSLVKGHGRWLIRAFDFDTGAMG